MISNYTGVSKKMRSSEILVARHGETDWNLSGRWQGHTDRPLNETGLRQARELATKMAGMNIDSIYSSDLGRAKATADIVAASTGIDNIVVDGRLRERNLGTFEGLTTEEICLKLGMPKKQLTIKEIGVNESMEKWELFVGRIENSLEDIRRNNIGKRVLVVAHGGVMGAIAMLVLNDFETPRRFTNGDYLKLRFEDGWKVHLPETV